MKLSKGLTLIELLVTTSIFALVIFTATDLFVSLFQQQRRTLGQQELLNQTSYTVEYMSRALRMAKKDDTGFCLGPGYEGSSYKITFTYSGGIGWGIRFINHSNNDACQEFFWDSLEKKLKESKNNESFLPIVSDSLQVNYFKIKLSGELNSDFFQPRVTVFMEIQVKGAGDQPKKQIQTTISQRNLDVW